MCNLCLKEAGELKKSSDLQISFTFMIMRLVQLYCVMRRAMGR